MPWVVVAGSSGAVHPSDSCGKGFIKIAADLESSEVVSAIPAESIGLSPDERLPHIASLTRAARALHEARIMLGVGAGTSRVRFSGKPICAVPSKTDVRPRSLEEEFGLDPGEAATEMEHADALIGGGSGGEGLQQLGDHAKCTAFHAPVTGALELSLRRTEEDADGPDGQGVLPTSTSGSSLWARQNFAMCVTMGTRLLGEVKNENLPFDDLDDNLQKQICASVKHARQAEQQCRKGKGAKTKDGEAYHLDGNDCRYRSFVFELIKIVIFVI